MLRAHLEHLALVCPACRAAGRAAPRLELGRVLVTDDTPAGEELIEACLLCPAPACRREHPIIDGVVVALAHISSWIEHQLPAVMRRDDLSAWMESLLGDAAGRGSSLDRERSDLSTYAGAHWGDLDAAGAAPDGGGLVEVIAAALAFLEQPPRGVWLDVGCALGRASFELARADAVLAVGVDLNFAMLRAAECARRAGRIEWPQRRVGVAYDRREAALGELAGGAVAFVCADAGALPFADGAFAGALSLNVLDCVRSPLDHLLELGRVLAAGAPAVLTTPYDWSASATAVEAWIGGHSQRGELGAGDSEPVLRKILSPGAEAGVDTGLVIAGERDRVPWRLRLHARATMHYALHMLRLVRRGRGVAS